MELALGGSGRPPLGDKHSLQLLPPQSAQEVAFLGNSEDPEEKLTEKEGLARVVLGVVCVWQRR